MRQLSLPALPFGPLVPKRSGLHWLVRDGDRVEARQPLAYCNVDFVPQAGAPAARVFLDEARDLQLVLASPARGALQLEPGLAGLGGWLDLHGDRIKWEAGSTIARLDGEGPPETLLFYFVAGRRGFEPGEGRGGLLTGWHERLRAFWPGKAGEVPRTLLALGTCEQIPILRGGDPAFAASFAALEGPAQLVVHRDDRLVHSAAILLQQLRRAPEESRQLLEIVQGELAARTKSVSASELPSDGPGLRNPLLHDLLAAQNLLAAGLASSPLLEQPDFCSPEGFTRAPPAEAIFLSVVSDFTTHFRHRRTGWLIAMHGFRIEDLGAAGRAWLREEFESFTFSLAEIEANLAALAEELRERTGARLFISNIIATSSWNRIPNYAWLGDEFPRAGPVATGAANLMLERLEARGLCAVVDLDAVTAEHGGRHCPDRVHASGPLPGAYRGELLELLSSRGPPRWRGALREPR